MESGSPKQPKQCLGFTSYSLYHREKSTLHKRPWAKASVKPIKCSVAGKGPAGI
jgi:hypothetical protein